MPANFGTKGTIEVFEDFMHLENDIDSTSSSGIVWGSGMVSVGDVDLVSVNEGSLSWTTDEGDGILAITTHTSDNDNAFLVWGMYKAINGGFEYETRFKKLTITAVKTAIYAGLTATLDFTTPVMPAEFATVTMTYNGTGDMIGIVDDGDATTLDFRALQGTGGAGGVGSGTTGVRARQTQVADEWYSVRIVVDIAGTARVYLGHDGGSNGTLVLVGNFTTACITPTTKLFACLGIENRDANAEIMEVDYCYGKSYRNWAVAVS